MKKTTFLLLFLISNITFAQRKLPYPIILIHGWTGGSDTWGDFTDYLRNQAKLTVSPVPLRFNLNADGNASTANLNNDVRHDSFAGIGNYDVYVLDFDYDNNNLSQSNQAAIVKQGYALSLAVREIINQSKCQRVMLLGHSMGGLVAREYLQNPNYPSAVSDIAKIVTIGTPHGGSNLGIGGLNITQLFGFGDIRSESVRDLRTSYKNGSSGVYLFGGYETDQNIQLGLTGIEKFYNIDINCNGRTGDQIIGLNKRDLVGSTDYACIIGGIFNDGVVTTESQNLKTIYPTANVDVFHYNCSNNTTSVICHLSEPKQAFNEMMFGLDETKTRLAPMIIGQDISGFFQKQSDGSVIDIDQYQIFIPSKGFLNVFAGFVNGSNASIRLQNGSDTFFFDKSVTLNNGGNTPIEVPQAGTYTISFTGNSLLGWARYNVNTSFSAVAAPPPCDFPTPKLDANLYELCEGITANILVNQFYDSYSWRKDGKELKLTTTDNFSITEAGTYSVEVGKCGTKQLSNTIVIIGKPNPKPTLTLEVRSDRYVLTSSGKTNQWQQDGIYTGKATVGNTFATETDGTYAARAYYDNGCNSISNTIIIKTEKPSIKIANNSLFCLGDTVKLETDKLFSKYRWIIEKDTITTTTNALSLTKASTVSVIAFRGVAKSPKSDSIAVKINPLPPVPTIFVSDKGLVSSSNVGNQWYSNNLLLPNETTQILAAYQGGSYFVKVTQNGCSSQSATFAITATETPLLAGIKVFPNPTNGIVNIALPSEEAYQLQISDLQGRIISTKEGKNQTQLELNLSALNTGIYFVNLSIKNRVFNSKIVVE